ncbi:MAG TPA: chemotaxis protein CheW [Gammaproteobacteria bacterium]|nr:chemotaxis protein CheW [Gammaproteobacteria bacterium]
MADALRSLRDAPFALLAELERRARGAVAGKDRGGGPNREWVGVGFRLGGESFLAARRDVREVLPYPDHVTRVPGARSWVVGLANVRGHLLPLLDLKLFLGGGPIDAGRGTRVLTVNNREVPAGLVVDEVFGFRRFLDHEHTDAWPPTIVRCERYLEGAYRRDGESWPVFSLQALVESPQFLQAAAPAGAQ